MALECVKSSNLVGSKAEKKKLFDCCISVVANAVVADGADVVAKIN